MRINVEKDINVGIDIDVRIDKKIDVRVDKKDLSNKSPIQFKNAYMIPAQAQRETSYY